MIVGLALLTHVLEPCEAAIVEESEAENEGVPLFSMQAGLRIPLSARTRFSDCCLDSVVVPTDCRSAVEPILWVGCQRRVCRKCANRCFHPESSPDREPRG